MYLFIFNAAVVSLLLSSVSAGPAIPKREFVSNALNPWVSVDASGIPVATYTPRITIINGAETTVDPIPYSLTAIGTATQIDSGPSPTSAATGGGSFQECNNLDGKYAPFCKPDDGSDVNVNGKYYVTWDRGFFSQKNASVKIVGNYVNETGHGPVAFESSPVPVSDGYFVWTIEKDWLQDQKTNNITLFLNKIDPPAGSASSLSGPTVRVKVYEKPIYRQPPTSAPKGQSLYIALPIVFGFIILCLLGGFFWNRKIRKIGLGNVMGRRRGYGAGKSKSQRMRLGKQEGDIQLSEREVYSDVMPKTTTGDFERNDGGLGSLVGSQASEHYVFRDERRRQEGFRFS